MKWLPDKKILSGGLAGIGAWLVILGLQHFGIAVPADAQAQIVGLFGLAIAYAVPPAERDIVKRLNDGIVAAAQADPNVPVTAPKAAAKA